MGFPAAAHHSSPVPSATDGELAGWARGHTLIDEWLHQNGSVLRDELAMVCCGAFELGHVCIFTLSLLSCSARRVRSCGRSSPVSIVQKVQGNLMKQSTYFGPRANAADVLL